MAGLGIGDLGQSLQMRRQNAQLKSDLARLSAESTTGKAADLSRAVGGDHRTSAALNRSLTTLAAYKTATTEAGLMADTMQTSIGTLQKQLEKTGAAALTAASGGHAVMMRATATDARESFAAAVSVLNVQVGGRSVFSGAATGAPLPGADDLMAALSNAIGAPMTAADAVSAVTDWFDSPTGFAAQYQGAATPLAPFALNGDERVQLATTAMDPTIKAALKGLALASLIAGGTLSGNAAEQSILMKAAGEALIGAGGEVAELAARVGTAQGHIAEAQTRNAAEASSFTIALSALTEVDPYDSATMLTATQAQLDTLYAVTARLSALSLTNYL